MTSALHLRPVGLVYGRAAQDAAPPGRAAPPAAGPAAFTLVEVIEGGPGDSRSDLPPSRQIHASGAPAMRRFR